MKHNLNFSTTDSDIKGFQEVIFSVTDIERWIKFFEHNCGWKLIHKSSNSSIDTLKQMWSLEDSVQIDEAVLHNEGDHEGFIRLVKFKNVVQKQIRSATYVWDTGGIFDVNMRTPTMDTWYRELQDDGWNGFSEPKRYVFGPYDVSEVLMKGPDGIVIAFMQRFAPPLEDFDHMGKTSRIFNSSVVVKDMEQTYDFYINKLGFELFFQSPGLDRETGHNVIGIPPNLNHEITVPIDIVRPDINNFGSIEYLKTQELKGRDCAEFAIPPNLGILMYRFPVRNVEKYAAMLQERGLQLNTPVQKLNVAPYGDLKIFSVRSPDGVWLEFIELIT